MKDVAYHCIEEETLADSNPSESSREATQILCSIMTPINTVPNQNSWLLSDFRINYSQLNRSWISTAVSLVTPLNFWIGLSVLPWFIALLQSLTSGRLNLIPRTIYILKKKKKAQLEGTQRSGRREDVETKKLRTLRARGCDIKGSQNLVNLNRNSTVDAVVMAVASNLCHVYHDFPPPFEQTVRIKNTSNWGLTVIWVAYRT